jgi:hypothetical protein
VSDEKPVLPAVPDLIAVVHAYAGREQVAAPRGPAVSLSPGQIADLRAAGVPEDTIRALDSASPQETLFYESLWDLLVPDWRDVPTD